MLSKRLTWLLLAALSCSGPGLAQADLPKLVEWTFEKDAGPFPLISNDQMVLETRGGLYRATQKGDTVLTLQLNAPYDREKPYAFEATMRVAKGTTGRLLGHYTSDDDTSIGMFLDDKVARPSKHLGKSRHADADAYAKKASVPNDFVALRVEFRPVKSEYSSTIDRLEITYLVNGKVVGEDKNGFPFQESAFGLQVWGKGTLEVRSYAFYGAEKEAEKGHVMQVGQSFAAADKAPKSAFTIGDPIYAVVNFAKPMKELFSGGTMVKIRETVRVGDQEIGAYEYDMDDADRAQQGSRYEVAFAPVDQAKPKYPGQASTLMKALLDVPAGKQKVKLSVTGQPRGSSGVVGLGSLEIDFDATNAAGRKKLEGKMAAAREAFLAKVEFPASLKKDPALEKGVKAAIKAAKWNQKVLKVAIMQSDWGALTHETFGTVLQRMINVAVGVKMQDGTCMIFYPTVFQKHLGGGKFSKETTLGGNHGIEKPIACQNLK